MQIISNNRKITIKELYRIFDEKVRIRTLQRDIIKLSEAGIPLISEKSTGNENIWYIDTGFKHFTPILLNINEYIMAYFIRKAIPAFKNTPVQKHYNDLVDKLDQLLPSDIFVEPTLDSGELEEDFFSYEIGTFDYSDYEKILNDVIISIIEKKNCRVTYKSPKSKRDNTFFVDPYKILIYKGGLYLIGFNTKYRQFNHLSINRIKKYMITERKFTKDQKYEEEKFFKERFGLNSQPAQEIEIKIDKSVVPYFEGRIWHHSQKMTKNNDGSLTLKMRASISDELISWIFSWHEYMIVKRPESLKNQIILIIEKMRFNLNKLEE